MGVLPSENVLPPRSVAGQESLSDGSMNPELSFGQKKALGLCFRQTAPRTRTGSSVTQMYNYMYETESCYIKTERITGSNNMCAVCVRTP